MTKTLKSIAPLQLGKILAIVYGLLSLLIVPFILLATVIGAFVPQSGASAPGMVGAIVGALVMIVIFPIMYAVMGFLIGVIGAWLYNLVAKWIGGLQFEVE